MSATGQSVVAKVDVGRIARVVHVVDRSANVHYASFENGVVSKNVIQKIANSIQLGCQSGCLAGQG